jgi:hypothetical protein
MSELVSIEQRRARRREDEAAKAAGSGRRNTKRRDTNYDPYIVEKLDKRAQSRYLFFFILKILI